MNAHPPPADSLCITAQEEGRLRMVRLCGSAGIEQVEDLEARLRELTVAVQQVVLDLSELTFITSAGLGVIIAAHRRCCDQGAVLCLAGPRPGVAQVLRITHLDRLITTYPSLAAARQGLASAKD